jgi:hypothetical protein
MKRQDCELARVDKLSIGAPRSCELAIPGTARKAHQNGTVAQHNQLYYRGTARGTIGVRQGIINSAGPFDR